MDRYQASIVNKITERHGPGWSILALVVMHRWSIGLITTTITGVSGIALHFLR